MTSTRTLHDGWSVRAGSGPTPEPIASAVIPATVPGVVHLDLMAAGLIPDPYLDDNESALAWIGLVCMGLFSSQINISWTPPVSGDTTTWMGISHHLSAPPWGYLQFTTRVFC